LGDWALSVQVLLTPTHLAIVMEYAAAGELFDRICGAGRFSEDEVIINSLELGKCFSSSSSYIPKAIWGLCANFFFSRIL
jgi:hypothetical protein